MKLYLQDLRTSRPAFEAHLPNGLKAIVAAFYVLSLVGLITLIANGVQVWQSQGQLDALSEGIHKATEQERVLESVLDHFQTRDVLVKDVQAWLADRYDLEAIYHQTTNLVPTGLLMNRFAIERDPSNGSLEFRITVEGDSDKYTNYFKVLTNHFTKTPDAKIANIKIDVRPGGALLSLDVIAEGIKPSEVAMDRVEKSLAKN